VNIGKVIGFTWFTITPPWLIPDWTRDNLLIHVDNFGDRHIPGFTDGCVLAYNAKLRGTLYSIAEKKLHDLIGEDK
jgi:hypothetical protein